MSDVKDAYDRMFGFVRGVFVANCSPRWASECIVRELEIIVEENRVKAVKAVIEAWGLGDVCPEFSVHSGFLDGDVEMDRLSEKWRDVVAGSLGCCHRDSLSSDAAAEVVCNLLYSEGVGRRGRIVIFENIFTADFCPYGGDSPG